MITSAIVSLVFLFVFSMGISAFAKDRLRSILGSRYLKLNFFTHLQFLLMKHGFKRDWVAYYNAVSDRPPRETLLQALDNFEVETAIAPRSAVDLGCGDGRDTLELLRRGWRVLAIDAEEEGIARLLSRIDKTTNLETQVASFETLQLPTVDLINASFSLPFCAPQKFPVLWQNIVTALGSGGRFCGQLFGDRDSWATYPDLNHHTRTQVEELLQPFAIEMFQEEEHLGKTAIGEEKYWHLFRVVARKR